MRTQGPGSPEDARHADRSLSIAEFRLKCGQVVGQSDWFMIDQAMVDRFADLTLDHQFIHVDPQRARQTEFGGTIAHGFLLLSMLSAFHAEAVPPLQGAAVAINSGFNRVRFVSPVRTGSRIRATFTLVECEEQKPGYWRTLLDVQVQGEGATKPALVAEWLTIWGFPE
jgi:acyl dehydratase